MTIDEMMQLLDAELIIGEDKRRLDIKTAFGADMMSDVLAFARPGCLLLTGLTTPQAVRTAFALDIAAIMYVRGKRPSEQTMAVAKELGIPLIVTKYILFETAGILYQHGIRGCIKEVCAPGNARCEA